MTDFRYVFVESSESFFAVTITGAGMLRVRRSMRLVSREGLEERTVGGSCMGSPRRTRDLHRVVVRGTRVAASKDWQASSIIR